MNREETHKLLTEGRTNWNTWARCLLDKRDAAEKEGAFEKTAAEAWFKIAEADFSSCDNPYTIKQADFKNFIFPGIVKFSGAEFLEDVDFTGANFHHKVFFTGANFHHNVLFKGAVFKEISNFKKVSFGGETRFNGSRFCKSVSFMGSTFTSDARLENVVFNDEAWFGEVTFNGTARFTRSVFIGNMGFKQATFEWLTIFAGVKVHKAADFSAINASRQAVFSDAQFKTEVPCFIQANFKEAPRLDNIVIPHFRRGRPRKPPPNSQSLTEDPVLDPEELRDRPVNYRALRRLALQGLDYRLAQDCVADEIRSARLLKEFHHPRMWIGFAYEILSSFGRSLLIPLVWLMIFCFISAGAFLWSTPAVVSERANAVRAGTYKLILTDIKLASNALMHSQPCYGDTVKSPVAGSAVDKKVGVGLSQYMRNSTNASEQAIVLAFHNMLILQSSGEDATNRTLGCLYGFLPSTDSVENYAANAPISMTIVSALQKIISALLIFLFGLAARNILRMQ